ncbi:MAG: hypothetical protein OSJ70_06515 [Bacilli bacterium]|nr:hypothetical protein [Bacilli bacterium]
MEWSIFFLALIGFVILSGKMDSIQKRIDNLEIIGESKNTHNDLLLEEYVGKKVTIEIDNDDIENSYLFDSANEVEGVIVEYDDEWLLFQYYHKYKKKEVFQYLRRRDLKSVNEIKEK